MSQQLGQQLGQQGINPYAQLGNLWLRGFGFVVGELATAAGLGSALAEPDIENTRQIAWSSDPSRVPELVEAMTMFQRGIINESEATELLRINGYHDKWLYRFQQLIENLPAPEELREMIRRGLIHESDAKRYLLQAGASESIADKQISLTTRLPAYQDVLSWLIRDVLNPAERERLQLDQDFPEESIPYFTQLGFDDQFARNMWASHWNLPSLTQSYRMFHRRLISREDLEGILRANDTAPAFREQLVANAYDPLTRVDVRRMHDMGVLDDDAVKSAYMDIGYDDTNSKLLLDFTKEYNRKNDEHTREKKIADDTIAELTKAFQEDVIPDQTFIARMADLGIRKERTDLILKTQLDIKEARQSKLEAEILFQQVKNGSLEKASALVRLSQISLNWAKAELWEEKIRSIDESGSEQLTKADILLAYKKHVLTASEAMQRLTRLGFTTVDALVLVDTHTEEAERNKDKSPTRKDIDTMRKEHIINEEEWIMAMRKVGFSPYWIERLDQLWSLKHANSD